METLYADIIINISHEALDRVFQYRVPFSLYEQIRVGQSVRVPFGAGNREQRGYVVRLSDQAEYDPKKIKEILSIEEDSVSAESRMIKLAYWIRENYGSTMIQALKTVLPVQDKMKQKEKKSVRLMLPKEQAPGLLDEYLGRHYAAKARLLAALMDEQTVSWERVTKDLKIPRTTVAGMEQDGIIRVETEMFYRNPAPAGWKRRLPCP